MRSEVQQNNHGQSNVRKLFMTFVACLSLIGLSSCGGDNINDKIEFSITPDVPFVRTGQGAYLDKDGEVQTVTAPWINLYFTIINKHPSYSLIIDSIILTATGSKNGNPVESVINLNLSSANCPDGSTRLYVANIPAGGTFTGDVNCDNTTNGIETWYLGSLAETDISSYTINIEASGYYAEAGNLDNPLKRVYKLLFTSTQ